ncbi:hypothetical protein ACEYYB_12295 [Paracoccus sp. p4-l81]|uniref:hypothetical protein n=1 Tax=Paracoccus sp. p4-l81 TaxID=3342806 RepID=UPI0035B9C3A6
MIRAIARLALLIWAGVTVAAAAGALSQHPFAQPLVERSADQARAALSRAMARAATPEALAARIEAALAADDADQIALMLAIADDQATPLPADLRARATERLAQDQGWMATAGACLTCMADIRSCRSLTLIGACAIPFEISPAGDVNALRRQGMAWASGDDVDEIEAALAGLGLAATAATVATVGGAAPIKTGVTALRVARRAEAISPGLNAALIRATREAGGAERLADMAGDVTRIARATSPAEVLGVVRLADDAPDLARLARLAEVAGPDSRKALTLLGKARALRVLNRVSTAAVAAIGLVALAAAQVTALALAALKLALRRALHHRPAPSARLAPPPISRDHRR